MKLMKFRNHNIKAVRIRDNFIISPYYYTNKSLSEESSMGDIHLNKMEMAILIVNLTQLLHNE